MAKGRLPKNQIHRLYASELKKLEGAQIIDTWMDALSGIGIMAKTKRGKVYLLQLVEDPEELNALIMRRADLDDK